VKEPKASFSIKDWNEDDRPREKLMAQSKATLTDAELVAILIGSGNREESAVALSQRIMASANNNLDTLGKFSVKELMQFKGIGEAKAISIIAALELGRRRKESGPTQLKKITSSQSVFHIMQPILGDLPHEEFWVIYVNNSNKVLRKLQLSKGGITGTLVDVRLAFKSALEIGAVAILLVHNHPSGTLKPSAADKNLTDKIKTAGLSLDVKVLDHIIITEDAYFSFADEGLM
jgi:DNA repair protein RadC